MRKPFVFAAIVIAILIWWAMSHEETVEKTPNQIVVISNWPDGTVKEERVYHDEEVIEVINYFDNFKVNTKGRMKVVGEEEVRIGTWKSYYKNGNHWSESEYSNGVSDGVYKTWHPNGKPNIIGFYSQGVETGQWQFFDTTGTIVKEYDVTPG